MPTGTILYDKIAAIFSEKLNIDAPSPETDLVESGILDSLTFVSLLFHLEQELEVKISMANIDIDRFRTIARISEFVAEPNGVIAPARGKEPQVP